MRAPNTRSGAVTAATIGENQKAVALLVAFLAFVLPPRDDTIDGERRSFSRRSPSMVSSRVENGAHLQAHVGCCCSNEFQYFLKTFERFTFPVATDVVEHRMLDRIPF